MDFDNMLITLGNNKKYIVVETVEYEGKKYSYLVNRENQLDAMFKEIDVTSGMCLRKIEPQFFEQKIFPLFAQKAKKNN